MSLAPLTDNHGIVWQTSYVRHKLQKVLWIPVLGERQIPLGERIVGQPILWQPTPEQEWQLQRDWEELMELIVLGRLNEINARFGEVMQLRPKGRNNRSLANAVNAQGEKIQSLPLGFYLRKNFTAQILQDFLRPPCQILSNISWHNLSNRAILKSTSTEFEPCIRKSETNYLPHSNRASLLKN